MAERMGSMTEYAKSQLERVCYVNRKTKEVIMPNEYGIMDKPCPKGTDWLWVRWPINPHFTGSCGIINMLLPAIIDNE